MAGRIPSRQLGNFSPDRSPQIASQGYPASSSFPNSQENRRVFSDFPEGEYGGDHRAAPPPQQMQPLVGVGIVFRRNPQTRAFVVDRMYQDGPALRSQNVAQGRVGSTVTLGLQCDDGKFREVTLRRAHCNDIEPPRRIASPPSSYAPPSRQNAPHSPMYEAESSGAEEEEEAEAGIGITFKKLESGLFFVGKITSGGPAARMGTQIQVQDILYKVDNAEVKGWDYKELANRIKGPVGSIVTMHFRRSGKPPHKAIVTRGHVSEGPVSMRGKSAKGTSHGGSASAKRSVPSRMAPKDGECGIGFALKPDGDKGFFISKILPQSPAMECGRLHVGDRVRKIDGHRVEGLSLDRVKSLVLGEEGSAMEIVVTDQQDRTSRHTILRRLVKGSVNSPIRPTKPVASSRPRSARAPPREEHDFAASGGRFNGRPISGHGYAQQYSPPPYGHPMYPPQQMEYYAPPPPPPYGGYPPHDPYQQPFYEQGYTPRGAPQQYPPPYSHSHMSQPSPPSRQYRQEFAPPPPQQPHLAHQDDGYDAIDQDGEAGLWDV